MLSLVDNRAFIRLSFRVLEHDPTQNDIRRFLADFKARLDVRGLAVRGVTTDGSELYPEPLKELWPDVPHQVCEFHVIKEITKAVLHALVATRKKLRDRIPKQPRGRPRKAERAQSRKATRQQQQVSKLFEHRYLFVQHRLTADQKTTLQRITRGLAHLRRLRRKYSVNPSPALAFSRSDGYSRPSWTTDQPPCSVSRPCGSQSRNWHPSPLVRHRIPRHRNPFVPPRLSPSAPVRFARG